MYKLFLLILISLGGIAWAQGLGVCVIDADLPCIPPASSCRGTLCVRSDAYFLICPTGTTEDVVVRLTYPFTIDSIYGNDQINSVGNVPCIYHYYCKIGGCVWDTVLTDYFCAVTNPLLFKRDISTSTQFSTGNSCPDTSYEWPSS